MPKILKHSISLIFMIFPFFSNAGYIVEGQVTAKDCYTFGLSVCSTKTVTEIRKDGKSYELPTYFEKVTEYNSSKGTCFIKTKSKDLGFLSLAINGLSQPDFWGYDEDGKYGKIDADYIRFKCSLR